MSKVDALLVLAVLIFMCLCVVFGGKAYGQNRSFELPEVEGGPIPPWGIPPKVSSFDKRPRLIVEPQFYLDGGGFQTVSAGGMAGLSFERTHFSGTFYGFYQAARKTNDGTYNNLHGNVRSLRAEAFYRTSGGVLIGCEGDYTQERTTNYNKAGYTYDCGGGKDATWDNFAMRLTVAYEPPVELYYELQHKPVPPPVQAFGEHEQGFNIHYLVPNPDYYRTHPPPKWCWKECYFDMHVFAGWLKPFGAVGYEHDARTIYGVMWRF